MNPVTKCRTAHGNHQVHHSRCTVVQYHASRSLWAIIIRCRCPANFIYMWCELFPEHTTLEHPLSHFSHENAFRYTLPTVSTTHSSGEANPCRLWCQDVCTVLASFDCHCSKGYSHYIFKPTVFSPNFQSHQPGNPVSLFAADKQHFPMTVAFHLRDFIAEPCPTHPHMSAELISVPNYTQESASTLQSLAPSGHFSVLRVREVHIVECATSEDDQ